MSLIKAVDKILRKISEDFSDHQWKHSHFAHLFYVCH